MSPYSGAHTPARERRGETETIAIPVLQPKRIPPRGKVFPRGWRDGAQAALIVFLVASASVPLSLAWVILGRHF